MPLPDNQQEQDPFDEILLHYLREVDSGKPVDRRQFIASYPDHAEALHAYFANCDEVSGMVGLCGEDSFGPGLRIEALFQSAENGDPLDASRFPNDGRLRDYRLLEKIGQGGMGAVYRAMHVRLEHIVALKVLPEHHLVAPQAVARFEREMKAVGKVKHPNIVQALDAGEENGIYYLVMEYVDGVDLSTLAKQLGPLPMADACEAVRLAAVGVQAVHEVELVHRDIKPSNIMLGTGGEIKILDLGLARLHPTDTASKEFTTIGQVMGTAEYMAPEQALESHTVDIRADIYSLGCTLYKLLTGTAPFTGSEYDTPLKQMMGHVRDPVPPIQKLRKDLPKKLIALIERMLGKQPEDRPVTPAEVAEALSEFSRGANLARLVHQVQTKVVAEAETVKDQMLNDTNKHLGSGLIDTGSHNPMPCVTPRRRRWYRHPAAILTLLFGFLLLGAIIFFATDRGTLQIETHGNDVKVVVSQNGQEVEIIDTKTQNIAKLHSGTFEIKLAGNADALKLSTDHFTLHRGDKAIVEVTRVVSSEGKSNSGTKATLPTRNEARKTKQGEPGSVGRLLDTVAGMNIESRFVPSGEFKAGAKLPEAVRWLKDGRRSYVAFWAAGKIGDKLISEYNKKSPPGDEGPGNPDHRAVEWLLERGERFAIAVNGRTLIVSKMEQIPSEGKPFHVAVIDLKHQDLSKENLEVLGDLAGLRELRLRDTHITDKQLANVRNLKNLKVLHLHKAKITDNGLRYLKDLAFLRELNLHDTTISDAGLAHLEHLKSLKKLDLTKTRVTAPGVAKLQKALPKCRIEASAAVAKELKQLQEK